MAKEIWSWVKTIVLAIVLALIIKNYAFAFYIVDGRSMEPTLQDGQVLMVNNFIYRIDEPERGDVIIFVIEDVPGRRGNWFTGKNALVKRVIALPGDTVSIHDGQVYVNDLALTEEYIECEVSDDLPSITIEEGEFFVLGDNRHPGASMDSRSFPRPLKLSDIVGRVDFVILPSPHKVD
jgi:signal peptidase I